MDTPLQSTVQQNINNVNVSTFISHNYDYIIIGGGTAGLVLANRLSENEQCQVAVLEAGGARLDDSRIKIPALAPIMLGKPEYDWEFESIPQEHLAGRVIQQNRGKLLGGSSALNFMMVTYESSEGLDMWEKLGSKGWGAKDIRPYFHKFQTSHRPLEKTKLLFDISEDPETDDNGPIHTAIYTDLGSLEGDFVETFRMLSSTSDPDPISGSTLGAYPISATIDPRTAERCHAATGYYVPAAHRKNLHVLVEAHVTKVLFDGNRASGVRFMHNDRIHDISATREVILSAGTMQSPQILELSGIGSSTILQRYNISPVVVNEGVGSNLQDHIMSVIPFPPAEPEVFQFGDATAVKEATEQFAKTASGPLSKFIGTSAFVSLKDILSTGSGENLSVEQFLSNFLMKNGSSLTDQQEVIKDLLESSQGSSTQFAVMPSYLRPPSAAKPVQIILTVLLHPLSRGTIHINSADPLSPPTIDPQYFSNPMDREILARSLQYGENAIRHPPFSSHGKPHARRFSSVDDLDGGLEAAKAYLDQSAKSLYHPCGTCAMLPRDKGGVVDDELRVYGVTGLRLVDASVFPVIPGANLQTLVYAVAERAADIIKASSN